jgi:hypothetical protein
MKNFLRIAADLFPEFTLITRLFFGRFTRRSPTVQGASDAASNGIFKVKIPKMSEANEER